jgi:carboxypeptidase PM20D1
MSPLGFGTKAGIHTIWNSERYLFHQLHDWQYPIHTSTEYHGFSALEWYRICYELCGQGSNHGRPFSSLPRCFMTKRTGALLLLALSTSPDLAAASSAGSVTSAAAQLSRYIQMDTSTPPGIPAESEPEYIAFFVETYAKPLGLTWQVFDKRTIFMEWRVADAKEGPLLFLGHSDVVPAEAERWTHLPFSGAIADGFVWGRGALDNKGSTITLLEAMAAMKAAGTAPRRTIQILVVPDEEIGGKLGLGLFLEKHLASIERPAAVIDEGSYAVSDLVPNRTAIAIAVGERTFWTVRFHVEAEGGHASMPVHPSAPQILAQAMARLSVYEFPIRILPPIEGLLDALSNETSGIQKFALKNRWLLGSLVKRDLAKKTASNSMIRNTHALTILRAGVKDNVIPSTAEAFVNLRLLPGEDPDQVLATLHKVIADDRIQIESYDFWGSTPLSPMEGPVWETLVDVLPREIPNSFVVPMISPGTQDARYFAQLGIPTYRFIPFTLDAADRQSIHGDNERVSLENLAQALRVYRALLEAL